MIKKLSSLLKLIRCEPRIIPLAWRLKRSKKTFLSWAKLLSIVENFHLLRKRWAGKPLQVSEFGVGRGGSAMLLGWLVGRYGGTLTLYDVFSQIPAPTEIDGDRAQKRYEKILHREDQEYYGNIANLLEMVLGEISRVCPSDRIDIIQGRYEEVLPIQTSSKAFDLVHIDCDWYESSRAVLIYLKEHLNSGAILQIDDYGHWQGSRQAFDESNWLKGYQTRQVEDALIVDTGSNNNSI